MPGRYSDNIALDLQAMLRRVSELSQVSAAGDNLLGPLLHELETSVEELRVADEELRAQNEQLALSQLAVEAERERYRDLFEFAPDGYLVTDRAGLVKEANRAAAELLGISQRRLLGKPLALYVAPQDLPAFRRELLRLSGETGRREWEIQLKPRHGPALPAHLTVTAAPDHGATPGGSLRWMLRDIRERKQAEEGRLQLAREQAAREEAEAGQARTRFLAEASTLLASSLDYTATIEQLTHLVVPQIAGWCAVHILGEEGAIIRLAVAHVDPSKVEMAREMWRRYPIGADSQHPIALALRTGRTQWAPEVPDEQLQALAEDAEHLRMVRELSARSYICVPLIAQGRTLGVLSLVSSRPEHSFSEKDRTLAEDLGRRAAVALDNARLYRELQEEVTERRQSEERYRVVVENARDYAILLMDSERRVLSWSTGARNIFGYDEAEVLGQTGDRIFTAEDREQGAPDQEAATAVTEGRAEDERWHVRKDGTRFWGSGVMTALRDGNLSGFLKVLTDTTERKQAEDRLKTAYQKERRIAEALQRSILHDVPENRFPGLALVPFYEAALDEAQVGGDFYDVFPLGDRVALVVGDASGKGLDAAARTAEVKFALRAFLRMQGEHGLARAMEHLNRFVCDAEQRDEHGSHAFISVAAAVLDPATGQGEAVMAGAEPPFVLRCRSESEVLPTGGLPLGVLPQETYSATPLRLEPNDVLFLFTDGLTEARRYDPESGSMDLLGYDRLQALAEQACTMQSLRAMGSAVIDGAHAWTGGPFHDDVCVLLARRSARKK